MTEALTFMAALAVPGSLLALHRAGLTYSIRCIGNLFYSLAHGIECGRREFGRLNAEARKAGA